MAVAVENSVMAFGGSVAVAKLFRRAMLKALQINLVNFIIIFIGV